MCSSPQNSSPQNSKFFKEAILNKNDYYAKLDSIIKDQTKFVKVNVDPEENHPVIAKESSIEYYVLQIIW